MKKIQLAPMIKQPKRVNHDALIAVTIVLLLICAGSVLIAAERVVEYLDYIKTERV